MTNSVGSIAQFTVVANGNGLTYQWSLTNGTILTNNGHFTGCYQLDLDHQQCWLG